MLGDCEMIFVAVGTNDFDALIEKMDTIAPSLQEPVVMQIGNGEYVPKNCEYFRFAPSLEPYHEKATLVVSHGGLGVISEALERGKKLVGVENTTCHGGHQRDLLQALDEEGSLIWCQDVDELPEALERAMRQEFKRQVLPDCEIHLVIKEFLQTGRVDRRYAPG
jgi:beta-1,4-N-acetylglucosaminyltransferase